MNDHRDPEDFEGGVAEMIDSFDADSDQYADLQPLEKREATDIKIRSQGGQDENEIWQKLAFSGLIAQIFNQSKKAYGYLQNAGVESKLESDAILSALALHDFVFNADCTNRKGRFADADREARRWEKEITDTTDVEDLLHTWHQADAFMLQAQIVEERHGIKAAKPLYPEFKDKKREREEAEMDAAKLRPAENMFFRFRILGYQIMNEQTYDLAMGYPTRDFTDVKTKLAKGANVHDLVHEMSKPWKLAYEVAVNSTSDGHAFHTLLMSALSQTFPNQAAPGYGPPPPGYYPYPQMNGQGGPEEEPDNRRPLFGSLFGKNGQHPQEPEPKLQKMRKPRRRNRGKR